MLSPEKLGDMVSDEIMKSKEYQAKVDEILYTIDGMLWDAASDLRDSADEEMKVILFPNTPEGEDAEMEYGMTVEGNLRLALAIAVGNKVKEL